MQFDKSDTALVVIDPALNRKPDQYSPRNMTAGMLRFSMDLGATWLRCRAVSYNSFGTITLQD